MNDAIKKGFWYLIILSLGLVIMISACKKKDKGSDSPGPAPVVDNTLQGMFATELKTDLIAAGLPEGQASLISSGALLEANQVLGVSASVRAISKSAVILVAPAIAQGAMKNIDDASVNEDKRSEIAGVIARSVTKSLNGRTGIMDVDKLVVLFKDVSDGAIGNMDDGGITDMQGTTKEVMVKFVGSLGESGLPSEDLSVAIKNLNVGAVIGLEKAGFTTAVNGQPDSFFDITFAVGNVTGGSIAALGEIETAGFKVATAAKAVVSGATGGLGRAGFMPSDLESVLKELNSKAVIELKNVKNLDAATKTLAIGNIASGSVGALGEIRGLTAEQIASSSKFITEGITKSLRDAGVSASDMAEVIVNTSSFAVKALDDAGLPKLYIKDAALGMLDSTFRSLESAGITDTTVVLGEIKTGIKASLDRLEVLKLETGALDAAKAAVDDYGTGAYVDPYEDSLVCSVSNPAGCNLATCSDQGDQAACGLVAGCSWDTATGICKEKADDTSEFVCPAGSSGTYPDCACNPGIFDKATNTCVAADVNCPTNAIKGTTAPDCACEAPIEYDPVTNTCGGNACPDGSRGTFPDCQCNSGVFDQDTLSCVEALCPADAKGTYPDCECGVGRYDRGSNSCLTDTVTCPLDASGAYPDCACAAGYTYDGGTNTCLVNTVCPADARGEYAPDCKCDPNDWYPSNIYYDADANECVPACPKDSRGTYPNCNCDTEGDYFDSYSNTCGSCPKELPGKYPDCDCSDVVKGGIYLLTTYGDPNGRCEVPPVCEAKTEVATQNYPYCECIPEALARGYIYVDGKGCILPK